MPDTLKPGQQIPGSNLLRDFCAGCNEPIRVTSVSQKNYCKDCEPGLPAGVELTTEQKQLWPAKQMSSDSSNWRHQFKHGKGPAPRRRVKPRADQ